MIYIYIYNFLHKMWFFCYIHTCTYVCCRCYIINTKIFLYIYHPAFCGVISHIQNTVDKSLQFLFAKGKRLARNVSHFLNIVLYFPPLFLDIIMNGYCWNTWHPLCPRWKLISRHLLNDLHSNSKNNGFFFSPGYRKKLQWEEVTLSSTDTLHKH